MTTEPDLSQMKALSDEESEEALEALRPRVSVTRASDVTLRRVTYLWDQRIPLGAFTLMPGEEGIGKTTVGVRLMADLTNGKLEGESMAVPRNVMVISPEDGIADVMVPRFQVAGADMDRVFFADGVRHPASGETDYGVVLPTDLEALSVTVREHEIAMVWIDSLVTTFPADMKTISYHEVSAALRPLNAFAERERIAVVAPWHLNKAGGHGSAARMMDSRAFRTATRSVLMVVPVESSEGATEGVVALDKANAGPTRHSSPPVPVELSPLPGRGVRCRGGGELFRGGVDRPRGRGRARDHPGRVRPAGARPPQRVPGMALRLPRRARRVGPAAGHRGSLRGEGDQRELGGSRSQGASSAEPRGDRSG